MINIKTIENKVSSTAGSGAEQELSLEKMVVREKLENSAGYGDEADMLAEMWLRLRDHGVKSDENLLFAGHNVVAGSKSREETFAVTAEEYAQALSHHYGETPLQYIEEEEGTPTVSVYDSTKLIPVENAISTKYKAPPNHTIDDALIAQFDVSDWL